VGGRRDTAYHLCVHSEEGNNVVGQIFEYYYHYTVELFPVALALALVGYMSSVSIATKVADMKKYEIDPSQELIALGLANFVGSFFSSFPGSISLPGCVHAADDG
jgi:SulP family sulfate permease